MTNEQADRIIELLTGVNVKLEMLTGRLTPMPRVHEVPLKVDDPIVRRVFVPNDAGGMRVSGGAG